MWLESDEFVIKQVFLFAIQNVLISTMWCWSCFLGISDFLFCFWDVWFPILLTYFEKKIFLINSIQNDKVPCLKAHGLKIQGRVQEVIGLFPYILAFKKERGPLFLGFIAFLLTSVFENYLRGSCFYNPPPPLAP